MFEAITCVIVAQQALIEAQWRADYDKADLQTKRRMIEERALAQFRAEVRSLRPRPIPWFLIVLTILAIVVYLTP